MTCEFGWSKYQVRVWLGSLVDPKVRRKTPNGLSRKLYSPIQNASLHHDTVHLPPESSQWYSFPKFQVPSISTSRRNESFQACFLTAPVNDGMMTPSQMVWFRFYPDSVTPIPLVSIIRKRDRYFNFTSFTAYPLPSWFCQCPQFHASWRRLGTFRKTCQSALEW